MKQTNFDILDLKIIDVLQARGRVASSQIGDIVGLSETAVYNRLKRIEESAAIRNYSARVDLRRVLPLQTFFTSVWLEDDRPNELRRFESQISEVPEIVECYYITGSVDYLLKTVAGDLDAYLAIINEIRDANPNLRRYETSAQVREVKFSVLPLERLGRRRAAQTK